MSNQENKKERLTYGAPQAWDESADVIVIGSGFAGLAAAAEAAAGGASVVVLEKMPYYGGNSRVSGGGYCSWDSQLKLREKLGLGEDSPERQKEDTLRAGSYYNDPVLVERMVREAPDGLNWLMDAGVEFDQALRQIGGHSAPRSYHEKSNSGRKMVEAVYAFTQKQGAKILLEAEVKRIWREDCEGPVLGVQYVKDGVVKNLQGKRGVVVASGGFARDSALMALHSPGLVGEYQCSNHLGATGEVLTFAKAIGAETLHMEFVQLYPCANPNNGGLDRFAFDCYSGTGYGMIYVNQEGRRFVNELAGRDVVSNAQTQHQKNPTFAILNKEIFKKLETPEDVVEKGVHGGRIFAGDTPQALAASAGIPEAQLAQTIREHNEMVRTGAPDELGKPAAAQMLTLETGPYYAIPQWPTIHFCMGGLKINCDAQVLDIWGNSIPGLYAAGEACGGMHGANRLGGNAIAECVVFGRIAGKALAR